MFDTWSDEVRDRDVIAIIVGRVMDVVYTSSGFAIIDERLYARSVVGLILVFESP
jgi:hypothetical protein